MLTCFRDGSLFSCPSCSIPLSAAGSDVQPAGHQAGGASWVGRRQRGGKSQQDPCVSP